MRSFHLPPMPPWFSPGTLVSSQKTCMLDELACLNCPSISEPGVCVSMPCDRTVSCPGLLVPALCSGYPNPKLE